MIVAEKPSVARDLARVLGASRRGEGYFEGEGLRVTWCVGHLVELCEPDDYDPAWKSWSEATLPIVPDQFRLRLRGDAQDQFRVVARLLADRGAREVINACDAGREGELIFRWTYELAGAKAPVQRLWVSSLTDEAILEGWRRLRPAREFDALGAAARCRAEADWLVGLNATRAVTLLARRVAPTKVLTVGRVQTPTLAMICRRDDEIAAFVPETFWRVKATFAVDRQEGPARWEAAWFSPGEEREARAPRDEREDEVAPAAERLRDRALAEALAEAVRGRVGVVERATRERRPERPPLLFDLTELQRRANQRYGFSADQTLTIAQALYERHKLITYPRTDSRYLTPDQVPGLPAVVRALAALPPYAPFAEQLLAAPIRPGRRVVDAEEVGDHHAILPTDRPARPEGLSPDEKRIYDLVARRLLAALSPDALIERTELIVAVPDAPALDGLAHPPRFRARGRVIREPGWMAVDPPARRKDTDLPLVEEGEAARAEAVSVHEGQTRPPPHHNDASLLKSMETAGRELDDAELKRAMRSSGLGTPATRAEVLKNLVARGFVERAGKELRATPLGHSLIRTVPVAELKSPELTGRWEARLAEVAEGRESADRFGEAVRTYAGEVVRAILGAAPPPIEVLPVEEGPAPIGECPRCGRPVRPRGKAFGCDGGRACGFVVFAEMSGRKISARMVQEVIKHGRSKAVKGFKRRRDGEPFEAGLVLQEDGRVGFWFPGEGAEGERERPPRPAAAPASKEVPQPRKAPAPRAAPPPVTDPVGLQCPACGRGRVVRGRAAWGCERWRDGCAFRLPFEHEGHLLTDAEAARWILERGRSS